MNMNKRTLGKDLAVSAVGLGCMGMTHAYGAPSDPKEMTKVLHAAVDMGYTFFDTAECYTGVNADGSTAYNEELVGAALKPYRHDIVIATKCGVYFGAERPMDSRPESIRKAIEGSLKRLQTDYIDLYYQHRIDPEVAPEEVAGVMSDLMKEGKILRWGISETGEEYLRRAHAVTPVTAIQNRYSMMARDYEVLFPVLEELNIGLVAFSPLANGILSDAYTKDDKFEEGVDFRSHMPQYTPEGFEANKALFAYIRALSKEKNCTPAQISLAWMICKKPYIVPIPGSRKIHRIQENFDAGNVELTAAEVNAIDEKLNALGTSGTYGVRR